MTRYALQCLKNINNALKYLNIHIILNWHSFINLIFFSQEAMKQHNIEVQDIESDYLGSEKEYKSPPKQSS